jgi:hypothetical protein
MPIVSQRTMVSAITRAQAKAHPAFEPRRPQLGHFSDMEAPSSPAEVNGQGRPPARPLQAGIVPGLSSQTNSSQAGLQRAVIHLASVVLDSTRGLGCPQRGRGVTPGTIPAIRAFLTRRLFIALTTFRTDLICPSASNA